MEESERHTINKNRGHLITHTNFDLLWECLKHDTDLFETHMTDDIFSSADTTVQKERFYNHIQNCKPSAFEKLINALSSSGQEVLSNVLLNNGTQVDSEQTTYPPLPPLIPEVIVQRNPKMSQWSKVSKKNRENSPYSIKSNPPGYLLLINMMFKDHPRQDERLGSEVDVRLLRDLFSQLKYEIVQFEDLTLEKMKQCVSDFSHLDALKKVDSIFVFVMSHGRQPKTNSGRESVDIQLEDMDEDRFINSNWIVDTINDSSTIRANVPRLFFFNMCRGDLINFGNSVTDKQVNCQDTSTKTDAVPISLAFPEPYESLQQQQQDDLRPMGNTEQSNSTPVQPADTEVVNNTEGDFHPVFLSKRKRSCTRTPHLVPMCSFRLYSPNETESEKLTCCAKVFSCFSNKRLSSTDELDERYVPSTEENTIILTSNGDVNRHPESGTISSDSGSLQSVFLPEPAIQKFPQSSFKYETFDPIISKVIRFGTPGPIHPPKKTLTGDIFISFSTVDGFNSKRHPERGTWFVCEIVKVFSEYAKDLDLMSMMEKVEDKLRHMFDTTYGFQIVVKKTEVFKKFYFNVDDRESYASSSL